MSRVPTRLRQVLSHHAVVSFVFTVIPSISLDQKYVLCVSEATEIFVFAITESRFFFRYLSLDLASKAFSSLFVTDTKPIATLSLQTEM